MKQKIIENSRIRLIGKSCTDNIVTIIGMSWDVYYRHVSGSGYHHVNPNIQLRTIRTCEEGGNNYKWNWLNGKQCRISDDERTAFTHGLTQFLRPNMKQNEA